MLRHADARTVTVRDHRLQPHSGTVHRGRRPRDRPDGFRHRSRDLADMRGAPTLRRRLALVTPPGGGTRASCGSSWRTDGSDLIRPMRRGRCVTSRRAPIAPLHRAEFATALCVMPRRACGCAGASRLVEWLHDVRSTGKPVSHASHVRAPPGRRVDVRSLHRRAGRPLDRGPSCAALQPRRCGFDTSSRARSHVSSPPRRDTSFGADRRPDRPIMKIHPALAATVATALVAAAGIASAEADRLEQARAEVRGQLRATAFATLPVLADEASAKPRASPRKWLASVARSIPSPSRSTPNAYGAATNLRLPGDRLALR